MKKIIIYLALFTTLACSKDKASLENTFDIFGSTGANIEIDEAIKDKEYKIAANETINSNKNQQSGNIKLDNFNKKLKVKFSKKYSSEDNKKLPFAIKPHIRENIIYVSDIKGQISAIDKNTKKIIWRNKEIIKNNQYNSLVGGIDSDQNNLYFVNGSNKLYCLNLANGNIVWVKQIESLIRSKPFINNDAIYIASLDNKIYKISKKDGAIKWQISLLDNDSSQYGSSGFASEGKLIYHGTANGEVIALEPEEGKIIWQENISSAKIAVENFNFYDVDTTPIIHQNNIYAISSNGNIASINKISGIKNWQKNFSGKNSPWITNSLIFIIDNQSRLIALNRNNAAVKWSVDLNKEIKPKKDDKLFYGPAIINGEIFVISNFGKLYKFDYNSGKLLNDYNIANNIHHFPIISDNFLYLVSNKSKLYQYYAK